MKLLQGNNLELLKTLEDNSIDSVVTDPPYGLAFMNKKWDYDVPSVEFWQEVFRVLKPGGHVLSFGGTRTYHRMVVNMEDAGFEIRDQIQWIYGSGFPKSHNIGKAVDKLQGNEREVVGKERAGKTSKAFNDYEYRIEDEIYSTSGEYDKTKGNSEFEGWGTALKPANEPICLARKPLSEKSVAENALKWGTGGINIDGCRVGTDDNLNGGMYSSGQHKWNNDEHKWGYKRMEGQYIQPDGRFPANVILECICDEVIKGEKGEVEIKHTGGASRFFYQAKVSKAERNMGLDEFEEKTTKNNHPTVKPINLMAYLCRLITPANGIVLDPFMGSGSTGIAARLEGFDFIGMEMDSEYFNIANSRINNYDQYNKFLKK